MSVAKLVTVYGGSGFLGRQITRMLAEQGWRVRVAVRRPNEAGVVRTFGAPGQVEPVFCNVRDDLSVRATMTDTDAVVNCVGIIVRQGRNNFDAVHVDAAERISRLSAELAIPSLVHVSALGADTESQSRYAATKGRGEEAVLKHRADAVILRPSVIFGSDDSFYNRIAAMSRFGPILPVPGIGTKVQPVYILDVARVGAMGAEGKLQPGIYELVGPDIMTMRQIAQQILKTVDRRRLVLGVPLWMAGIMGGILDAVQTVSGGLLTNRILTKDQVKQLRRDNVAGQGTFGFADLGIEPTASGAVIGEYLWRFRPLGQYESIIDTAKQLRRN